MMAVSADVLGGLILSKADRTIPVSKRPPETSGFQEQSQTAERIHKIP